MLLVKKDLVPHCIQIFSYSTGTMSAITCCTHNPLTRTPLNKRIVTYTVNNILPCVGLVARIIILFEYKCVVNSSEIVVRGKYVRRYATEYSCEYSCVYMTEYLTIYSCVYLTEYLTKYSCEYSLVATLKLPNMPRVKDNDHTSTKSLMSTIQAINICHELYDCLNIQGLTGYQILNICRKSNIWQCI